MGPAAGYHAAPGSSPCAGGEPAALKVSSSRMKNKVGAQKGAFIKMKQENSYIYQRIYVVCYVPIIAPPPSFLKSTHINKTL